MKTIENQSGSGNNSQQVVIDKIDKVLELLALQKRDQGLKFDD